MLLAMCVNYQRKPVTFWWN